MRSIGAVVTLMVVSLASALGAAEQRADHPKVFVVGEQGTGCGGFAARDEPYREGLRPILECPFWDHQDVVDADHLAVTGLGFYGWAVGGRVTVAVFTLVPARGAPNRYLARNGDDMPTLTRPKPLATFTLEAGQSEPINQMKSFGLPPYTIRVCPASTPMSDLEHCG